MKCKFPQLCIYMFNETIFGSQRVDNQEEDSQKKDSQREDSHQVAPVQEEDNPQWVDKADQGVTFAEQEELPSFVDRTYHLACPFQSCAGSTIHNVNN